MNRYFMSVINAMRIKPSAALAVFALLLTGCMSEQTIIDKGDYQVETRHEAQAAYPRMRMVVIHYTAEDFDRSIEILTGKDVSSHYLIPEQPPKSNGKPLIWQLMPEEMRAWHAGASFWRGSKYINDISIGIELENPGWQNVNGVKRFSPFSSEQITALETLVQDVVTRNNIAPHNIVGHSDIAPQRKEDPGPLFPWQQLAEKGIGAWPDAERVTFYLKGRDPFQPVKPKRTFALLARYGYDIRSDMTAIQQKNVIMAFQMHFRPELFTGITDAQTEAIAEALVEKYVRH